MSLRNVAETYYNIIFGCFIWDLQETLWIRTTETSLGVSFETFLRRTDRTSLLHLFDKSLQRSSRTSWIRTTETSW